MTRAWAAWLIALAVPASAGAQDAGSDPTLALTVADESLARTPSRDPDRRAALLADRGGALLQLERRDEAAAAIAAGMQLLAGRTTPAADIARADLLSADGEVQSTLQRYPQAEAAARAARTIRARLFGEGSVEVALADAQIARDLISQSKLDEAVTRAQSAWTVLRAKLPNGDAERVSAGFYLARALANRRRPGEAEAQLRLLLDELPALPTTSVLRARLPNLLGFTLMLQGRVGEAMPYLRQAIEVGENVAGLSAGERANNFANLGAALLQLDRPADALPVFEEAAAGFEKAGLAPAQSGALIFAGGAADRAGDRARGLVLREKAVRLVEDLPGQPPLSVALNRFKLAQSYAHAGRLEEAEALEAKAAETIAGLRPEGHFQVTNSRIALGWIQVLRGRHAEGMALVRAAFRRAVEENALTEVSQNRVVGVLDNIEANSQALDAAIRAGDQAFAFEVIQVMLETDASRAAVAVTQRQQAGDTALGRLLRTRQEAAAAVGTADAAALQAKTTGAADAAALGEAAAGRRAALVRIDAELDVRFPGFRTLLRPRAVTIADLQARLARDERLLAITETDVGLVTVAIGPRDVAIGRDPMRRHEVRALIRRVRGSIDDVQAGMPGARFAVAEAARLHRAIVTPEIARLTPRGTRLRLVPGDLLSTLPLSLLASREDAGGTAPRWWIEDHPLSVLPSFAALGRAAATPRSAGRFVGVGAPLSTARAGAAVLAPLPGAAREIAAVAERLGRTTPALLLTGADAQEARIKAADLSGVDVLLFATHGLVAGATGPQSEPALVLTAGAGDDDGLFTASEAAALQLDANWVILSACDTAAGDDAGASGYTGLARAFLFAGARRVVASHWPVRDDVSARLAIGLAQATLAREPADVAMQRAVLALMRDPQVPGAGNPAVWAPFMLVAR